MSDRAPEKQKQQTNIHREKTYFKEVACGYGGKRDKSQICRVRGQQRPQEELLTGATGGVQDSSHRGGGLCSGQAASGLDEAHCLGPLRLL